MFYKFFKVWTRYMLKVFYRKHYLTGFENIPADKPLLIASNHPNGFIEPLTIACLFKRPLYFLVRGDVFKNPITRYFLKKTHQIPIFRFKDGFAELRKNQKSISESLEVLQNGHAILIFVEGGTKQRKHLRPLQKGMARIAFQSLEADPDLDLHVLPVGVNFRHNETWRSDVMLNIGQPFAIKPILDTYGDSPGGIKHLMSKTREAMISEIIHLDQPEDETFFTDLADLTYFPKPKNFTKRNEHSEHTFKTEKRIASFINTLDDVKKDDLKRNVLDLKEDFNESGMQFSDLQQSSLSFYKLILMVVGLIPALIGFTVNGIPYLLGSLLAESKAKGSIFHTSIIVTSGTLIYFLYYSICILVASFFIGWKALFLLLGIPLGLFALYYFDHAKSLIRKILFSSKTKSLAPKIKNLLSSINEN